MRGPTWIHLYNRPTVIYGVSIDTFVFGVILGFNSNPTFSSNLRSSLGHKSDFTVMLSAHVEQK